MAKIRLSPPPQKFLRELVRQLANEAKAAIAPKIKSDVLRDALRVQVKKNVGALYIPHYWALYVHEGRGPFGPKKASFLVWFSNQADDPRLQGGYPVRLSDVRRLTKEQFHYGLRENARRLDLGISEPYMIVTPYFNRRTPGTFFFTLGAQDFERTVPAKVDSAFDAWVRQQLGRVKQPKPARARLR